MSDCYKKVTTALVLWRKIHVHQNIAASQQSTDFLREHCHKLSVESFYSKQKILAMNNFLVEVHKCLTDNNVV